MPQEILQGQCQIDMFSYNLNMTNDLLSKKSTSTTDDTLLDMITNQRQLRSFDKSGIKRQTGEVIKDFFNSNCLQRCISDDSWSVAVLKALMNKMLMQDQTS